MSLSWFAAEGVNLSVLDSDTIIIRPEKYKIIIVFPPAHVVAAM